MKTHTNKNSRNPIRLIPFSPLNDASDRTRPPRRPLSCPAQTTVLALLLANASAWAGTDTYSVAGSATWTCPPNVNSTVVECWGGGGAGGGAQRTNGTFSCAGGGGGGAAYSRTTVSVTPGNSYLVWVGAGGLGMPATNGNPGGDSAFAGSSALAKGGAGGSAGVGNSGSYGAGGGCPSGSTGLVNLGGSGATGSNSGGGGGGGSGGTTNAGGNASGITGGSGGNSGGGAGANGSQNNANGYAATAVGGGGAGAYSLGSTLRTGGAGADGKLQITCVGPDFRSQQSGLWNSTATWQTYNGSSWIDATTTPKPNNNTFIQSGHTVTLQQNEACGDLHIASGATLSPAAVGLIALQNYTLSIYGKLRCFTQAATGDTPGTSSTSGYSIYPFTASAGGKVSVVGNARFLTLPGEWSDNITATTNGVFPLELNLYPGQTASLTTTLKFTSLVINSGTLDAANNRLAPDSGSPGHGDVTINAAGVLRSAQAGSIPGNQVMSRTTTTRGGTLIVTRGAKLVLGGNAGCIDMNAILLNGAVEYNKLGVQTFCVRSGQDTNAANPDTYTDLILSGNDVKMLWLNTTVNGTLTLAGNGASLNLGGYTFTYGPTSTLAYAASVSQTTTNSEFPAVGGPHSLTISNANGVTLAAGAARTINGTLTMAQGPFILGTGASLAYGPAATLAYAGLTPQTTAPAEFPTANGPFNLTINNLCGVTLAAGASRTINGTVTMVQGPWSLGAGAAFLYGPSATLAYAGANPQTTATTEFPASHGPFHLSIQNTSGVALAASRAITGTLSVTPGATLDLNAQTLTCGSASLAGTLTMPVIKSGPNTFTGSKLTQSAGPLTYAGALTVTATGSSLAQNDSIPLFIAASGSYSGGFTGLNAPAPAGLRANTTQLTAGTGGNLTIDCAGTLLANAAPDAVICPGSSYPLNGSGSQGSGSGYTFTWTSTPPGFTSTAANPSVSPTASTTYHLTVTDDVGCTATRDVALTLATPPTAAADTCDRVPGLSLKITKASLLANDSADAVFASLPSLTTANHVTLAQNETLILYPANAPNADDSFTYTITDAHGCPGDGTVHIHLLAGATGGVVQTIAVNGNSVTLSFLGVPACRYQVQRATTLAGPGDWADTGSPIVAPTADPAPGLFSFTDTFTSPPPATAFYRLRYLDSAP